MATLNLHVVCDRSRVSDCARDLAARVPAGEWEILVALAAEVVSHHESRSQGETRVLVAPADLVEKIAAGRTR